MYFNRELCVVRDRKGGQAAHATRRGLAFRCFEKFGPQNGKMPYTLRSHSGIMEGQVLKT